MIKSGVSNVEISGKEVIQIHVNGTEHRFDTAPNISELLHQLDLATKRLAIERNGELVPRSAFDATVLSSGDRLEVVMAVGGG